MKPLTLLTGALAWAAFATASAHTPYLSPSNFAPQAGETLALDASFAETFFVPEAAFDNSRFAITGPDGASVAPDRVQVFKTRAVVEHRMPQGKGSYRFSTGPRLGALFRTWEVGGKRESSRDPAVKIPNAATSDHTNAARPYPSGCRSSFAFAPSSVCCRPCSFSHAAR